MAASLGQTDLCRSSRCYLAASNLTVFLRRENFRNFYSFLGKYLQIGAVADDLVVNVVRQIPANSVYRGHFVVESTCSANALHHSKLYCEKCAGPRFCGIMV
jgi:hypothetical protein